MTLSLEQQGNLDRLIVKRYHTGIIAEMTGLCAEDIAEYRHARRKARHGERRDREPPIADPLLPALQAWRPVSPLWSLTT